MSAVYERIGDGMARYTFTVRSDTSRADRVFFKIRFDAPLTSVVADSGAATEFTTTLAPQVIGVYDQLELDPVSAKDVAFNVSFDPDLSTACIEDIECSRCSRSSADCGDAFKERALADLAQVCTYFDFPSVP